MRNWKKISAGCAIVLLLGIFSCEDTTSPDTSFTVTISGTVTRESNYPLDSVIAILGDPYTVLDTTDLRSQDNFSASFVSSETDAISTTLRFHHINPIYAFIDTVINIAYSSTNNTIRLNQVIMRSTDTSQNIVQVIRSGRPGVISFTGSTFQKISIRGAGANDATNLSFVVKDSIGVPVDETNKATVYFNLITKPDTFTVLSAYAVETNASGQAIVQLTAGEKSGLAQLQAYSLVKRPSDTTQVDTITSPIVSITIAGGLAVESRFTIGSTKYNIPGLVKFNLRQSITAVVGDTFGNPAQAGTVVYFSTTGGIIQPVATTSEDGDLSVDLITGNPIPPNGIATVTAQIGTPGTGSSAKIAGQSAGNGTKVINEKLIIKGLRGKTKNALTTKTGSKVGQVENSTGTVFTRTLNILFSGPTNIAIPDTNFTVSVGGNRDISYTVSDFLGNPLTEGTAIAVKVEPADVVELTGDVDVKLPDTMSRLFTQFKMNMRDIRKTGLSQSVPLKVTVSVASENGNLSKTASGFLLGTGGATVDSSIVGRIVLVNPMADTMLVSSTAGANKKDIQFMVYNTFGLPAKNVLISFELKKTVAGGEYVTPASGVTDDQGLVTASLISGAKSGEVQVIASASREGLTITSDAKIINMVIPKGARLASQIQFGNISTANIDIAGVGGIENADISYVVKDSLGFPIDKERRVLAVYDLQFDPSSSAGGGTPPSIIPSSDSTDDTGNLRARVVSGTQAGVVTVKVLINLPGRAPVTSTPVKITIHAGFADRGHFTLVPSHYVFAGHNLSPVPFTVLVGDTFSNPVDQGTAVYFSSQAGVMQTGNVTDAGGFTTGTLVPAHPHPDDEGSSLAGRQSFDTLFSNGRRGYHWVWAQTRGRFSSITDSVLVVQAIAPIIITGIPDTTVLIDNVTRKSVIINITVKDARGNPLPDGTTMTAVVVPPPDPPEGFSVTVSGDFPVKLPNASYARFPGPGITDFSFRVIDASQLYIPGMSSVINITISAPGVAERTVSFDAQSQ